MKVPDDKMFSQKRLCGSTLRQCVLCGVHDIVRPGSGRSYGFVAGNKSRGRMIQHFKAAHPAQYAELAHPEQPALQSEEHTYLSFSMADRAFRVIHQGLPISVDKPTAREALDVAKQFNLTVADHAWNSSQWVPLDVPKLFDALSGAKIVKVAEVCGHCGSDKPVDQSCGCFDNHCQ